MNASIDHAYYTDSNDGTEPHGYWLKDADYERKQARIRDARRAVSEGRASWIHGPLGQTDAPDALPF